ncbi:facilitated trehalose transporter Tret1 [Manduca sexta]|uniref:facilitated trehalose transporter Tret1 n=1 Tax=Manduca sexta TaxID=7130 RepID=UPI001182DDAD|nr:facilitated trehalose transporter Tret1 [Manduca sexta]XP_030025808.1 facilitated trehalose transporter Tret1 [Manduca sexta]XP_030025809.1 facilitated trehalose transporter Tret1 [Manduca sexta]
MTPKMKVYWKKQLPVVACIYIGQMLVGYGLGWTAPVVLKILAGKSSIRDLYITEDETSWIGSALYLGTIASPYITTYVSDTSGRKPCLVLGGVVTLISFCLLAYAYNFAVMIFGRILCGLGTGIIFVVNFLYIAEITSTEMRGISLTVTGIFGTVGTFIVYSIGPLVSYVVVCYIGVGIAAVYIIGMNFIPETPVYQVLRGKENEAKQTLLELGREDEVDDILLTKLNVLWLWPVGNEWMEIFTNKTNRKALFITLSLYILQQMSGVISMIFFCTLIFGYNRNIMVGSYVAAVVLGITQIVGSSITPFFYERYGRRSLLLWSTGSCSVCMALVGLYFFLKDTAKPIVDYLGWLPLVVLIIFFLSYDFGFGIVPAVLLGEMFPPNLRGIGSAITITSSWLVGFGVTSTFAYMLMWLRTDTVFWIYTASCAAAFFFTAKFVPETKGKTFMEIQELLSI